MGIGFRHRRRLAVVRVTVVGPLVAFSVMMPGGMMIVLHQEIVRFQADMQHRHDPDHGEQKRTKDGATTLHSAGTQKPQGVEGKPADRRHAQGRRRKQDVFPLVTGVTLGKFTVR